MGSYRHLSREDREEIAVLRAAGHSNAVTAAALGRLLYHDGLVIWHSSIIYIGE